MGKLTPGATYIYEKANGTIYAREEGADPDTRIEIGWDHDSRTSDGRPLHEHLKESKLWGDIHRAAKSNPLLQEALDRVKILYELSKKDESKTRN